MNSKGQKFLVLFLEAGGPDLITCSLSPRVDGKGYIFALPSQKGCAVGCNFCSVPGYFGNLSAEEILQIIQILEENAPTAGIDLSGRNKICFVKGGELLQNKHCREILQLKRLKSSDLKISTVFPEGKIVRQNLEFFLDFCESFPKERDIGLQFSALSTSKEMAAKITKHPTLPFFEVGQFGEKFFSKRGRKITLSLTATDDLFCRAEEIVDVLPSAFFNIRIYPYKSNARTLTTMEENRLLRLEQDFCKLGYTIVASNNQLERSIGYFDEQNEILKSLVF